jgi:hypothetical protein
VGLRLTPQSIIAAYEYLRTTAPFNKWKLPHSDELAFEVIPHTDRYGHLHSFPMRSGRHQTIGISIESKTTADLIETLAHEMIHLKQLMDQGYRKRGPTHGPSFKTLAKQVCRYHGFNLVTF